MSRNSYLGLDRNSETIKRAQGEIDAMTYKEPKNVRESRQRIEAQVVVARPGAQTAYFEHMYHGVIKRVLYESVRFTGISAIELVDTVTESIVADLERLNREHPDESLSIEWRSKPKLELVADAPGYIYRMRLAVIDETWDQYPLARELVHMEGNVTHNVEALA